MAAIDMSALENAIGDGLINIGAELNEIAPGVAAVYGPGAGLATGAAGDALTLMGSALTGQSSGLSDEQIGMALGALAAQMDGNYSLSSFGYTTDNNSGTLIKFV